MNADQTLVRTRRSPRCFQLICGWLLAAAVLGGLPATAQAQFENPNRAFHKGTAFPLDGRHLTVACESCHIDGVYQGTPTGCADCHWIRRQDDVYKTRLGMQCAQCHKTTSWSATNWNHAAATGVVLNAAHRTVGCDGCHREASFTSASTDCFTCHRRDFETTQEPNHLAAGFSTACESCHRPSDSTFEGVRFDHDLMFPLLGVHAAQACASCHTGAKYAGTPRDCFGCHRDDYERTTSPGHQAAGFSTACETCHRETDPGWDASGGFNHAQLFPLNGAHATAPCASCHAEGRFQGTPRDCVGCHRSDYDRTTNPNHAAAGFSTDCQICHRDWDPDWNSGSGSFEHDQYFRLLGVHTVQSCSACHTNGAYSGTPRSCVGCHRADYDRTVPSHLVQGYPTTCEDCHSGSDPTWQVGRSYNHSQVFVLLGQHAAVSCTACHVSGIYRGTARSCVGCHLDEYNQTTQPAHAPAGFSTACETCHSASAPSWTGAVFDHQSTFPLVGRHATAACASCHVAGIYQGTPTDCAGCHLADYQGTQNPNHLAAGFPTTCQSCHKNTDVSWSQGVFVHSWFPITSGNHRTACVDCHANPSNYKVFTCLVCHTRTKTDSDHQGENGYVYDSNACYACHPNGKSAPRPELLVSRRPT